MKIFNDLSLFELLRITENFLFYVDDNKIANDFFEYKHYLNNLISDNILSYTNRDNNFLCKYKCQNPNGYDSGIFGVVALDDNNNDIGIILYSNITGEVFTTERKEINARNKMKLGKNDAVDLLEDLIISLKFDSNNETKKLHFRPLDNYEKELLISKKEEYQFCVGKEKYKICMQTFNKEYVSPDFINEVNTITSKYTKKSIYNEKSNKKDKSKETIEIR